jgi:hypothetical protein
MTMAVSGLPTTARSTSSRWVRLVALFRFGTASEEALRQINVGALAS